MSNNDAEHIWSLMARKLSGEASPQELEELDLLLRQHPDKNYSKEILEDLWQIQSLPNRAYAESKYKSLVHQIKNLGLDEGNFVEEQHFIQPEPSPEKNSSVLSLTWALTGIIILFVSLCIYFFYQEQSIPPELASKTLNEITTKGGSKTSLVLPDGTKIWLNASSKLTYDKNYGKASREVSLSGEAYFDVVKNTKKPFIIHTANMDIRVLGTVFNVKCYPGEKTTETSLLRGSIEVSLKDRLEKIMLKPNEKLVLNHQEQVTAIKPGRQEAVPAAKPRIEKPIISLTHLTVLPDDNIVSETAWVQNKLIFSSENFEDVVLKMEHWYNVEITLQNENLRDEKITGNFEKESLLETLNALKLTTKFSYRIKNNEVLIY